MVIGSFLENSFEATLSSKTNFVSVWKEHFSVFCKFLSDEVETVFWESETKHSKLFKSKFGHRKLLGKWFRSYIELKNEMFWAFEKSIFQFFPNFWVAKVKPFSGKVWQSIQNYLNQNLVIGSFLENGFEATLSSKTNVVSVWKEHFSVFCKFLSDEVETIFWESEAKLLKLFKSKFGHRKLLRKWFRSYLELKNECCEHLKRAFFSFLQVFEGRSWICFLVKRGNAAKTLSIKSNLLKAF